MKRLRGKPEPQSRRENESSGRPEDLFTEAEAARYLRMTVRMLQERRKSRRICCIKDGNYIAYTREQLDAYWRANTVDEDLSTPRIKKSARPRQLPVTITQSRTASGIPAISIGQPETPTQPKRKLRRRLRPII